MSQDIESKIVGRILVKWFEERIIRKILKYYQIFGQK